MECGTWANCTSSKGQKVWDEGISGRALFWRVCADALPGCRSVISFCQGTHTECRSAGKGKAETSGSHWLLDVSLFLQMSAQDIVMQAWQTGAVLTRCHSPSPKCSVVVILAGVGLQGWQSPLRYVLSDKQVRGHQVFCSYTSLILRGLKAVYVRLGHPSNWPWFQGHFST